MRFISPGAARLLLVTAMLLVPLSGTAEIRMSDSLDREVVLDEPAQRVVSLAPHITELVYAAGAGDQLVAAVSYSDYPEAARDVPRIGSYDSVSLESVLAIKPDLVLAWVSGNGREIVQRLEALGITVYADEPRTLEDVERSIRLVGKLTGNDGYAGREADAYRAELDRLRERYSREAAVSVFYQIWNEPLLTLNGEHLISNVVSLCGGKNVFSDAIPLVVRLSVETVIRKNPQVIVASGMDEARPEWLDEWRQWKTMQAVENGQLYFVPPDILQRHTPRILQGASILCEQIAQARAYYYRDEGPPVEQQPAVGQ